MHPPALPIHTYTYPLHLYTYIHIIYKHTVQLSSICPHTNTHTLHPHPHMHFPHSSHTTYRHIPSPCTHTTPFHTCAYTLHMSTHTCPLRAQRHTCYTCSLRAQALSSPRHMHTHHWIYTGYRYWIYTPHIPSRCTPPSLHTFLPMHKSIHLHTLSAHTKTNKQTHILVMPDTHTYTHKLHHTDTYACTLSTLQSNLYTNTCIYWLHTHTHILVTSYIHTYTHWLYIHTDYIIHTLWLSAYIHDNPHTSTHKQSLHLYTCLHTTHTQAPSFYTTVDTFPHQLPKLNTHT